MRTTIVAVALMAALGACAGPRAPLMSPVEATGNRYGFAERPVGDERYEVSFTLPFKQTTRNAVARQSDAAALRNQAFDFALWRSAQIALDRGYKGFRVVGPARSTVDNVVDDGFYSPPYAYDPFWGPFPYSPATFRRRHYPFYGPPAYNYYSYLQAQAVLEIELVREPAPGEYDAADTIEQLRRTYPNGDQVQSVAQSSVRPLSGN